MATAIGVEEARTLIGRGAQLVEVLPSDEYQEEHLPGAINIPLRELGSESVAALERGQPIIVYCWDYQ